MNDGPCLGAGIELYEEALALDPRQTETLYNLAVIYGETRQLHKAVLMYEMTTMAGPQCAEAHNNLGVIYRELGNMERAMQCYRAALEIRPNFPQALNNVAVVLTAQVGRMLGCPLIFAAPNVWWAPPDSKSRC